MYQSAARGRVGNKCAPGKRRPCISSSIAVWCLCARLILFSFASCLSSSARMSSDVDGDVSLSSYAVFIRQQFVLIG